jgi:tetratricopeptide (TPR) repeat protein
LICKLPERDGQTTELGKKTQEPEKVEVSTLSRQSLVVCLSVSAQAILFASYAVAYSVCFLKYLAVECRQESFKQSDSPGDILRWGFDDAAYMRFDNPRNQNKFPGKGGHLACPCLFVILKISFFTALFLFGNITSFLPVYPFTSQAHSDFVSLDAVLRDAREARLRFDYAGALRLLDKAAKVHQASAELFNEYGLIYLEAEEPQQAADYFDRALKIKPDNDEAFAGRVAVDLMNREYKRAESKLREFLLQHPRSGRARAMLANTHFENHRIEEAEAEAKRALAIDANDKDALHILVLVKVIQKEPNEARKLAERALEIAPYDAGMRRLLAQFVDGRAGYLQWISRSARFG